MSLADYSTCYVEDRNACEVKYDRYPAPLSNADFVVHIHVIQTILPLHLLEEEEEQGMMLSDVYDMETLEKSFSTQSDLLIHKDNASCASNISHMLSEVDVPEDAHEDFIQKISIAARRIAVAAAKENIASSGSSCLTMNVQIEVVVIRELTEDHPEEEDVNNNNESELGVSRTAVKVLEKVIVTSIKEGEGEGLVLHECAICLETIEVGSEGIRMPCSHMFHGGCILRWLERSKRCPYCRFEIWWR